jgi:hypothetical protein
MFAWHFALEDEQYQEFETWTKQQETLVKSRLLLEMEKIRQSGLPIDTAKEMINQSYETHVYPIYPAFSHLLLCRNIMTRDIYCFGHSEFDRGEFTAIETTYKNTCRFFDLKSPQRITIVRE